MAHKSGTGLTEEVSALRERIEAWRATRTQRSPMPSELWDGAVSLAKAYGVNAVAAALKVSFDSLKRRVLAESRPEGASRLSFVEVDPNALFHRTPTGPWVEVTSRRGDKLTLYLCSGSGQDLDIGRLARAFVGLRR